MQKLCSKNIHSRCVRKIKPCHEESNDVDMKLRLKVFILFIFCLNEKSSSSSKQASIHSVEDYGCIMSICTWITKPYSNTHRLKEKETKHLHLSNDSVCTRENLNNGNIDEGDLFFPLFLKLL
jgi:hypothetical protein